MLVYRIAHKKYTDHLFAPGISGRWNSAGKKVLYCADSIPLAFLECMIRRQGAGFNHDYNIIIIEAPDDLAIKTVSLIDLQDSWRDFRDYSICRQIGDAWFDTIETPVLKVPSAVITDCCNYVFNARHAGYQRLKVIGVSELVPDPRIDELLQAHRK